MFLEHTPRLRQLSVFIPKNPTRVPDNLPPPDARSECAPLRQRYSEDKDLQRRLISDWGKRYPELDLVAFTGTAKWVRHVENKDEENAHAGEWVPCP